jgi:tRNA (guanine-N7-)-methyltransferase
LAEYGVEFSAEPLSLDSLFGRAAPRTLEIGFGNGEHLAALAAAHPERDYFGIEVHRPGVGHLLLLASTNNLTNVRRARTTPSRFFVSRSPKARSMRCWCCFPIPGTRSAITNEG